MNSSNHILLVECPLVILVDFRPSFTTQVNTICLKTEIYSQNMSESYRWSMVIPQFFGIPMGNDEVTSMGKWRDDHGDHGQTAMIRPAATYHVLGRDTPDYDHLMPLIHPRLAKPNKKLEAQG